MMLMGSIYKNALSWFFLEMDSFLCKVVQHAENAGEGIPHNFNVGKKKVNRANKKQNYAMLQSDVYIMIMIMMIIIIIDKEWMNLQIRTGSIRTTVCVISLFCIQNLSHTALYNLWK